MSISKLVRPNVRSLKPYRSARDEIQSGILLDANENPFPEHRDGIELNRYPDPNQADLRRALADFTGLAPESILAGAGSDEVLDWVLKVFCQPGRDRAAILEPTYGMYRVQADILGVEAASIRLGDGFDFQADRFLDAVGDDVKVAFLCSPNNPTGNLLDEGEILRAAREWGRVMVVDEAYIEFAERPSMARHIPEAPNLVVMRTLSKAFARAAIRLGYALASPEVIGYFRKVKAPYNLNALTMGEGVRCLRKGPPGTGEILRERERLRAELGRIEEIEEIFPSQANFILFRIKNASSICRAIQKRGVVVRDRSKMEGLDEAIRVSVGQREENDLFLRELANALDERKT